MKKKILFIDRDGTLIMEPEDYQVDSLEKVTFYPKVFTAMNRIANELDYELVMVTNQDGLGTEAFPEDAFWPAHQLIMKTLESEGIIFDNIIIDRTFKKDNQPTRKPGTALLTKYFSDEYDLAHSFVIGDRITDMELAYNLGAKGIFMPTEEGLGLDEIEHPEKLASTIVFETTDWIKIYDFLKGGPRKAIIDRSTNETKIHIELDVDGIGKTDIQTGIAFFDHMLDQLGRHGMMDLVIKVDGDLEVDEHHTIEDTALALGAAFKQALSNKMGMERYGFVLPMDDCLAQAAIDFGGRPWMVWEADFKREMVGKMPTEMFFHFFKSFSDAAACNLNIKAEGTNEHHKIEAIFKAFARAIKAAVRRDLEKSILPSTKGTL